MVITILGSIACNLYKETPLSILNRKKTSQYHMQTKDGHYEYGYSTGNSAKYEIKTKDGITRGSYSYTDPNEVLRVTNYVSDIDNGYRARNTEHGPTTNPWGGKNINADGNFII